MKHYQKFSYDQVWRKSHMPEAQSQGAKRKAKLLQKMENYELGVKSYPGLKACAEQRNLQSNCERIGFTRSLRRIGHCRIRETVKKIYGESHAPLESLLEDEEI